jgi:hypothetical protein
VHIKKPPNCSSLPSNLKLATHQEGKASYFNLHYIVHFFTECKKQPFYLVKLLEKNSKGPRLIFKQLAICMQDFAMICITMDELIIIISSLMYILM